MKNQPTGNVEGATNAMPPQGTREDNRDTAKWATILLFAIPIAIALVLCAFWLLSFVPWPTWLDNALLVVGVVAGAWFLLFVFVDAMKHG